MNEDVLPPGTQERSAPDTAARLTAGAMLRAAREAAGLHIGALAVTLRVPVKKLEALEADRFELLPDIVFVRALAASVCRNLNIDPLQVLARLPQTDSPHLRTDESGINVTFRANAGGSGSLFWDQISKPSVLIGFALLIGALIWAFIVYSTHPPVATADKAELAAAPVSAPMAPPLAASASPAAPLAPASESAAPVTVAGSGATNGTLVFKSHGASWVEVVDGTGVVQLRKMLAEGETVGVSGVMPLAVVIGRSDLTEVQVHGKAFDLTPIARDNVARFEVKQ
jgi:cytoskeleton protein RodZ